MTATASSATVLGVQGHAVTVEVQISNGLPGFTIVGLPDTSCREARDRVRAAVLSSGFEWPSRRITVNLAPSNVRKAGSQLDLAMAVALLVAAEQLEPGAAAGVGFLGELGLDGTIRPVTGTVPLVDALATRSVVVAAASADEALLVGRHEVRAAADLEGLVAALRGEGRWAEVPPRAVVRACVGEPDLAEVRGQPVARLALELAAAGGHHLLMVGPPGAGKTMLARRLPGLLPDLTRQQSLEVTRIHSAAGLALRDGLVTRPPFRAPHHAASLVSLTGGGSGTMRPGEISLAHQGVLFLDELGEFSTAAIDALRQPLEEGVIRVSRAAGTVAFPAEALLLAAMNPCPCGRGGAPGMCSCSDAARARYHRRISGPILDRFDLRIDVAATAVDDLLGDEPGESSATVRARVEEVRRRALERGVPVNARLAGSRLDAVAPLGSEARRLLESSLRAGRLTGRGLHRVRRLALTIADRAGVDGPLAAEHVAAALALRSVAAPFEPRALV